MTNEGAQAVAGALPSRPALLPLGSEPSQSNVPPARGRGGKTAPASASPFLRAAGNGGVGGGERPSSARAELESEIFIVFWELNHGGGICKFARKH